MSPEVSSYPSTRRTPLVFVFAFLSLATFSAIAHAACPTDPPTLRSPAAGARDVPTSVTLEWTPVTDARTYNVYARINGGATELAGSTTDTRLQLNTTASSTVDWYVQVKFDACPALDSASQQFTTAASSCPTAAPVLLSPAANDSNLVSPVTLKWDALTNATGYELSISTDGGAFSVVDRTGSTSSVQTLPSGNIDWRVAALYRDCPSVSSETRRFTVARGNSCSTEAAVLVSPDNSATTGSVVDLIWRDVTNASGYRVWTSRNNEIAKSSDIVSTPRMTLSLDPASYSWYVETLFSGCDSTRSEVRSFTVPRDSSSCTHDRPTLQTPAEGARDLSSPITLKWTPVNETTGYHVLAAIGGGTPFEVASTTDTSVVAPFSSGSVAWSVRADFRACDSTVSDQGHFTVAEASSCRTETTALSDPADGATVGSRVTFRWSTVAGASGYRLFIVPEGRAAEDLGSTTETSLTVDIGAGKAQWYVETRFAGCPSTFSERRTLITATDPCAHQAVTNLSPSRGVEVTSEVSFRWSGASDATEYHLLLRKDDKDEQVVASTFSTDTTIFLSPGSYRWRIEARYRDCPSTISEETSFVVKQSASCSGGRTTLVSPPAGAGNLDSRVTFSWTAVSGAKGYELWIDRDEGGEFPALQTSETSAELSLDPGVYKWRVFALEAGCNPTPSEPSRFTVVPKASCGDVGPTLLAPEEGQGDLPPTVKLEWSAVDRATGYDLYASIARGELTKIGSTQATSTSLTLPAGEVEWLVVAQLSTCSVESAKGHFEVTVKNGCDQSAGPDISSVAEIRSGDVYDIRWSPLHGAVSYVVQESLTENFGAAESKTVTETSAEFVHSTTAATPYFYRVRAQTSCGDTAPFSVATRVVVLPIATPGVNGLEHIQPVESSKPITQTIFIAPPAGKRALDSTFNITTSAPWLTVTPASGTIPPSGVTLSATVDPRTLGAGTSSASIAVNVTGSAPSNVPVNVNLVTPVSPGGSSSPTQDTLIIPAVAHANGQNSQFQSDVRLSNLTSQVQRYVLSFTASGTNGTTSGKQTTIQVEPGDTTALDDILKNFYGIGTAGDGAVGMLVIRPTTNLTSSVNSAAGLASIGSSRTYNNTPNGTFGQFIPAVPYSEFGAKGTRFSLQQVAQSSAYRTNLGIAEGSGQPATVDVRVYADSGAKVGEFALSLQAGEHRQLNSVLADKGLSLDDGRLEVQVTSDTGRVTTYASVVDNKTNDPLLVSPINLQKAARSKKIVLPGIADLNNGVASWRSDVRIFNAGTSAVPATLKFYPQSRPDQPSSVDVTIAAGEVRVFDNVLQSLFGLSNTGGALHIVTTTPQLLVATARTYNQTANGTYGQFIQGVSENGGTALTQRGLEVLQVEESARFRTNLGLTELSGSPATVVITAVLPDSKATPRKELSLRGNEFVQLNGVLKQLNLPSTYNGRLVVSVIGGAGRVDAYASVIDNQTQDPTYIPAQ